MLVTASTHRETFRQRIIATRVRLAGRVQGFGVRPTIARLAMRYGLVGQVGNTTEGVEIVVQGCSDHVSQFVDSIPRALSAGVQVDELQTESAELSEFSSFEIRTSVESEAGVLAAPVPHDLAMCEACRDEIAGSGDVRRRVGYAFTSCTDCGPRFSIVRAMPYERTRTSMSTFAMCDECRREYQTPDDRRFHAQTDACRECGPQLALVDRTGDLVAPHDQAISTAAKALLDGKIIAIKGLGGYQLLVRADDEEAVQRLRERKRRRSKPLAVMVRDVEQAQQFVIFSDTAENVLRSPAAPIVLVRARDGVFGNAIAVSVTRGINRIGLMLPTTPLHWLLLDQTNCPLVCTSGNLDGVPLEYERDSAQRTLGEVADLLLHHDRAIVTPIDDSVVHVMSGRIAIIRLGRGYAPTRLELPRLLCGSAQPRVALGGHMKNTIAIWNGSQAVLGPHVGDLNTVASRERFLFHRQRMSQLYGTEHSELCCDLHPDFFTTTLARDAGTRPNQTQHHHAHVLAGMTQAGWLDREVLGVAFDGTGYGDDGTIWGGEFLQVTAQGFRRVAHLRPFTLVGGEKAFRQPWRVALTMLVESCGIQTASTYPFRSQQSSVLLDLIARHQNTRSRSRLPGAMMTTSAGRLFDAAACLILGLEQVDFEGQAAMLLESSCDLSEREAYEFRTETTPDWRPVVRQILHDRAAGIAPARMAMKFHRAMARAITLTCQKFSPLPVVLSGGVFQNQVLTDRIAEQFSSSSQHIALPRLIPVNDGGLAVGQLVHRLATTKE